MNEEYIKKLEEENKKLNERICQIIDQGNKKEIELIEKDRKLNEEYLEFKSYASDKSKMVEMITRLVLQFEHQNNLDLSEPKDLTPAIEQWNQFNKKFKELRKYKPLKITWTQYEKINEEGRIPNLNDYTEHMYYLERMMDWQYDKLSDEEKKEYDKCRDYIDNLLDRFIKGE